MQETNVPPVVPPEPLQTQTPVSQPSTNSTVSVPAPAPAKPTITSTPPSNPGFPRFNVVISLFIGVVAILIGIAAYWMGMVDGRNLEQRLHPSPSPTPIIEMSPEPTVTPEMTVCTMDAQICPDGTVVGRSGPNCEFVCPAASASESAQQPGRPGRAVGPPAQIMPQTDPAVGAGVSGSAGSSTNRLSL